MGSCSGVNEMSYGWHLAQYLTCNKLWPMHEWYHLRVLPRPVLTLATGSSILVLTALPCLFMCLSPSHCVWTLTQAKGQGFLLSICISPVPRLVINICFSIHVHLTNNLKKKPVVDLINPSPNRQPSKYCIKSTILTFAVRVPVAATFQYNKDCRMCPIPLIKKMNEGTCLPGYIMLATSVPYSTCLSPRVLERGDANLPTTWH